MKKLKISHKFLDETWEITWVLKRRLVTVGGWKPNIGTISSLISEMSLVYIVKLSGRWEMSGSLTICIARIYYFEFWFDDVFDSYQQRDQIWDFSFQIFRSVLMNKKVGRTQQKILFWFFILEQNAYVFFQSSPNQTGYGNRNIFKENI